MRSRWPENSATRTIAVLPNGSANSRACDMQEPSPIPPARDKLLFTPGPLTTSQTVKQAMLRDVGSWHYEFNAIVKSVRERLLEIAGLPPGAGWEAILDRKSTRLNSSH